MQAVTSGSWHAFKGNSLAAKRYAHGGTGTVDDRASAHRGFIAGCTYERGWEAEDVRVLRKDPNAIVREHQRRAWLRYGVEE
jgi:hypothetical protein